MCQPNSRPQIRSKAASTRGPGHQIDMNKLNKQGASAQKNSRLPPTMGTTSSSKTGLKRGIAGLNSKARGSGYNEAPIKVPKKNYNLNNLGPDAYPDGEMPSQSFVTGGGGGDGLQ